MQVFLEQLLEVPPHLRVELGLTQVLDLLLEQHGLLLVLGGRRQSQGLALVGQLVELRRDAFAGSLLMRLFLENGLGADTLLHEVEQFVASVDLGVDVLVQPLAVGLAFAGTAAHLFLLLVLHDVVEVDHVDEVLELLDLVVEVHSLLGAALSDVFYGMRILGVQVLLSHSLRGLAPFGVAFDAVVGDSQLLAGGVDMVRTLSFGSGGVNEFASFMALLLLNNLLLFVNGPEGVELILHLLLFFLCSVDNFAFGLFCAHVHRRNGLGHWLLFLVL